jgi:hypothetical protein
VRPQRTEREGHDDAEHADEERAAADTLHFIEVRFQSD